AWLRGTLARLRRPEQIDGCQPGRDLRATLRPYQADGVRWLWFMTELGLGACLADDMGLGKTIQVLDLLLQHKRQRPPGRPPSLLLVPASAQSRGVKKLQAGGRMVLTGTPVENHLGDLWSIFDFCCPGLMGTAARFKEFVKRLNKEQDAHAFGALRRLVRPYILRRLKTD